MKWQKKKARPIVCPRCGRKVGEYIDRFRQNTTFSCSMCKIYLVYCRDDDIIKVIKDDKDKRVASSGRRFL